MSHPDEREAALAELRVMEAIARLLDELNSLEVGRILRWACDRYGVAA